MARVALVTGGTRGIGAAISKALKDEGYSVAASYAGNDERANAFKEETGCGLLVNTSFNIRGEPIVCTPFDAYRCFRSTDMDYLVINNFLYCQMEQQEWENKEKWCVKFKKD